MRMEPRAFGVCRPSPREESFGFFSSSQSDDCSDRGAWPYSNFNKKKTATAYYPPQKMKSSDSWYDRELKPPRGQPQAVEK